MSVWVALATQTLAWPQPDVPYNAPRAGNPILPGYFADPTIRQFGDTFYIYATTDGSGAGFGPAQCWASRDLCHWTLRPMNWPTSHWIWAPDVMQHSDGKYYMVYCQPCNLYIGQSDTPVGPWHNLLADHADTVIRRMEVGGPQAQALGHDYDNEGQPIWVYDRYVEGAITLDGQTFTDDDGSVYVYWGTWGIYKGFGCGVGKASADLRTFTQTRLIPNTEAKDFFEAPFVLKRGGLYYLMYSSASCHDSTYHVQYATSTHPMGPYQYQGTILQTSADGTVHGPGHHSVLTMPDGSYYIVYHRHDNPHSNRGFHRQVCMDRLTFDASGRISPIVPTHTGVRPQLPMSVQGRNLALGCRVQASSYYSDDFVPAYAVDDNNGTLWRPRTMGQEWLLIDLGRVQPVQTVWTQWEYGTLYYQYRIECSTDGRHWLLYADRSHNRSAGSPKVDVAPPVADGRQQPMRARYVRITSYGCQRVGYPGALWNVQVYATLEDGDSYEWPDHVEPGADGQWLVDVCADDAVVGDTLWYLPNRGTLQGGFVPDYGMVPDSCSHEVVVRQVQGRSAVPFDSATVWASDFAMPRLWADNVPYRLEADVLNPDMALNECVADFTSTHDELEKVMLVCGTEPRCGVLNHYGWYEDVGYAGMASMAGQWMHVAVDFDGRIERVWINDRLVSAKDIQLMLKPSQRVLLGRNAEGEWPFTGYLHRLRLKICLNE